VGKTVKKPCSNCGKEPFGPAFTNDRKYPGGWVAFMECDNCKGQRRYVECGANEDVVALWNKTYGQPEKNVSD